MKSPFPGMDPYLEDPAFWRDFHARFVPYWCDYLAERLPEPYEARLDESVNLVAMSPETFKLIYPDVSLTERPTASLGAKRAVSGDAGTLVLEPVTIPNQLFEEVRDTRVEILHRPTHALVTVLELLSPWNKTGDGFYQYQVKRRAVLGQRRVHLVELDLLVGGQRPPLARPLPAGDYYALVSRGERRPDCDVYAWTVRQRFPLIPIPLRAPDPDLCIELGAVFDIAYERGRYARSLPYGEKPKAPLADEDAAWAQQASKPGTEKNGPPK